MADTRFTLFAFALLCLLATGANAGPTSRIIGGDDVNSGKLPWVASLRVDGAHKCGGAIIGQNTILTVAHCLSELGTVSIDPKRVTVRVGSINQFAGGAIVNIESIRINPGYGNFLNDLAIVTLPQSLTWSDKVSQIGIATTEEDAVDGATVAVAGWGLLDTGASPYKLQETQLTILSKPECELQAGYGYDTVLCLSHAENKGTTKGDDGAPVVANGKLVGILSFVFGAGGTKYPDVASRVSSYADWIESTTN